MFTKFKYLLIFSCLAFAIPETSFAHPQGSLIVFKGHVLWTFVYPITDRQHHSSVFIWDKKSAPKTLISSEFSGSDFFLYPTEEKLYIVESKSNAGGNHTFRLLSWRLGGDIEELWPWQDTDWNVGSNGFYLTSGDELVFAKYPNLYKVSRGTNPTLFFTFDQPIHRMRKVASGEVLLLATESIALLDEHLAKKSVWSNLINANIEDAPINRNMIFGMDYNAHSLLFAYWGSRSFVMINEAGESDQIHQVEKPFTSHLVAFDGDEIYLFALVINPPDPVLPELFQLKAGAVRTIWGGE